MRMKIDRGKFLKRTLWTLLVLFAAANGAAFMHAYKFTNFSESEKPRTKNPEELSTGAKIKAAFLGVSNPRPQNDTFPARPYETVTLQSNKRIECWRINADSAKGTVILFHGYAACKSMMLDKAEEFLALGYNAFLVDFMGCGGSEGNQTTIGWFEAEQVKTCFEHVRAQGEKNIFLFGTSLGAAAVLKAIRDHDLAPAGIIIECPFGSMYQTTCARFESMGIPEFPMAALLVFWGGVQNGFWAFSHCPEDYAAAVKCPALLLYGEKDARVSRAEIDTIYARLGGKKTLRTYPEAGHENYLIRCREAWCGDVRSFLEQNGI